jgi:cell division protein FtsB
MGDMAELEKLGARREALRAELADLTERLRVAALAEHAAGGAEAVVARAAHVDRMTMRRWLGKR